LVTPEEGFKVVSDVEQTEVAMLEPGFLHHSGNQPVADIKDCPEPSIVIGKL
jgi:hypothetical protein